MGREIVWRNNRIQRNADQYHARDKNYARPRLWIRKELSEVNLFFDVCECRYTTNDQEGILAFRLKLAHLLLGRRGWVFSSHGPLIASFFERMPNY